MDNSNSLNELIKKAQNGDTDAFENLVLSTEKMVFNIAFRMMSNVEDARDISQEVFIKAFKNMSRFDGKSSFSTWIYRIAVNTCIDEIRKRKGKETLSIDKEIDNGEGSFICDIPSEEITPENAFIAKETSADIQDAIGLLSQEHRTIITLRDLHGLTYTEISDIIGISMGTVKSRLTRARKNLKDILIKEKELYRNIFRQN